MSNKTKQPAALNRLLISGIPRKILFVSTYFIDFIGQQQHLYKTIYNSICTTIQIERGDIYRGLQHMMHSSLPSSIYFYYSPQDFIYLTQSPCARQNNKTHCKQCVLYIVYRAIAYTLYLQWPAAAAQYSL